MEVSRYRLLLTFFVFVLGLCISCSTRNQRLEQEYLELSSTRISLPDEMLCVQEGSIKKTPLGDAPYKFLYYIDSTECSSCSIAHLSAFNKLIDLSESNDSLDFVIIFSPMLKNSTTLAEDLNIYEYDFPVYIDDKGAFRDSNRHIPSNRLFHQFLIKADGIPIFVGSPLTSSEMSQLFYDTLKTLNIIPNS